MYRVIRRFYDLTDRRHEYAVGDTFPRSGFAVSDERIAELSGANNKQGMPLIAEVKPKRAKKKTE